MGLLLPLVVLALQAVLATCGVPTARQKVLKEPMPTQFEVAMSQTLKAVKEGREPDPMLRKPDGTPGTLLDALLPEVHRRKLGKAASWRLFGANIPFLSGPTLAALNGSYFRYASVSPLSKVDWRKTIYITPIQMQYDCASCWVMAAVDSVAMATGIATGVPSVPGSVQQICDCTNLTCCDGGWPEDAFAWMVSNGNITTAANYNYWANDNRQCTLKSNYPVSGYITGWERVPLNNMVDLAKAVNMQPVLVYISASSKDFQNYSSTAPGTAGFRIYDGNCTSEVNHAVLLVGYDTTGSIPYWIVKNTWPVGWDNSSGTPVPYAWGHNGYMYLVMKDGPGKCGMQTVNPLFPVYFPNAPTTATVSRYGYSIESSSDMYWWQSSYYKNANACTGIINPCGGGQCFQSGGIGRCLCPSGYVEQVLAPTSMCIHWNPCMNSLVNPCGAGTCLNVGDGSYLCSCPLGYTVGSRVNGASTCIPVSALNVKTYTYMAQYGDTCAKIQSAYGINSTTFTSLNPYIKCSKQLIPGLVVNLAPASIPICIQQYAIRPGDTCGEIAYYMDKMPTWFPTFLNPTTYTGSSNPDNQPTLLADADTLQGPSWYSTSSLIYLNPTLNCSSLMNSQLVCVGSTASGVSASPIVCGQTYTTQYGDSCGSIANQFRLNSTYFKQLNPGLNCNYNYGTFYDGVQICVAPTPSVVTVNCTQWYTVQQGDTCAQIWNAANMSQFQLLYINPGLQCQPPYLYVGLQICIDSPLLNNIPDPSFLLYTIQPNDTWGTIQAQFSSKCVPGSISIPKIAAQNNISNWVGYVFPKNGILVIPCVPKVGASCGCVNSLYVCGSSLVTYNSYCDARCNFATPLASPAASNGACSTCQLACQGRYGKAPPAGSGCPSGYVCPWPIWPPPTADASATFTSSPLCNYRQQSCQKACAIYAQVNNIQTGTLGYDSTCYAYCYSCKDVPCSGPSYTIQEGTGLCPTCDTTAGCQYTCDTCITCSLDCSYWNSRWTSLNP